MAVKKVVVEGGVGRGEDQQLRRVPPTSLKRLLRLPYILLCAFCRKIAEPEIIDKIKSHLPEQCGVHVWS